LFFFAEGPDNGKSATRCSRQRSLHTLSIRLILFFFNSFFRLKMF
jgi:hypothetical protein